MEAPLVATVWDAAQAARAARAVRGTGRALVLVGPPWSGRILGPGVFAAILDAARDAAPDLHIRGLYDCGDAVGDAYAALRCGVCDLIFVGAESLADDLAVLTGAAGGSLRRARPAGLDMTDVPDGAAGAVRLRAWAAGRTPT